MLPYFAATLFVSASLLFLVQPMVGKMILPRLGGTPAVWNTCMVFFQAVLLIGYGYTHTLSTWCSRRTQLLVQLGILLMPFAFLMLPFTMGNWSPPGDANPIGSVLLLLSGMVGLPFFVVATSAPLLQKWFAETGHAAGKDPYFLYGASNLGSMLALVLYPLAVEPLFPIGEQFGEQAWLWSAGYALLTALIGGCVVLVWRSPPREPQPVTAAASATVNPPAPPLEAPKTGIQQRRRRGWKPSAATAVPAATVPQIAGPRPVTTARRLRWLALAAVPSSLMLGVTTFLTTDVAAIPFFWVIPLGLYLLTFILVFSRWPVVWTDRPHLAVLYLQPFALVLVVMYFLGATSREWILIAFVLHVTLFFLTTLMCHGELAKDRPDTRHLTEFYLWMSLGGVAGGIFNGIIAPLIFRIGPLEYPLAMIGAYLLRPGMLREYVLIPGDTNADEATLLGKILDWTVPAALAVWAFLMFFTSLTFRSFNEPHRFSLGVLFDLNLSLFDLMKILMGMVIIGLFARPARFAVSLGAFAVIALMVERHENPYVFEDRDFFGFVRVCKRNVNVNDKEREFNALIHGDIDHGWQASEKERRREPLTYFYPLGGVGQAFDRFNWFGDKSDGFSWPDHRIPAALAGMGASPLDAALTMAVQTQSEPPYGCIGLGIGTLAAHAKPLQFVRFYEIQPLVKRLSFPEDGSKPIFHFLQDARDRGADIDVVLGDGRLLLKDYKIPVERYYHIFVIDAFSSDAIPQHLLTKEALELYLSKLAEGGLLIFNTTNRYVDLNGPLRDLADELDLSCYHYGASNQKGLPLMSSSDWLVLQRRKLNLDGSGLPNRYYNGMTAMPGFVDPHKNFKWVIPDNLGGRIWDDRYSNLLSVMSWR